MPTTEELISSFQQEKATPQNTDALIAELEGKAPSTDDLIAQLSAPPPQPEQAPGILQALGGTFAPPSTDLSAASGAGIRDSLTGRAGRLLGEATGMVAPNTPEAMAANAEFVRRTTGQVPQYDFQPDTAQEQAAYWGANIVADPIGNVLGLSGANVALKATGLANKAERLAKLSTATRVLPRAQEMIASVGTRAGIAGGAGAGAAVSGFESGLSALEDGSIDPLSAAMKLGVGTVGGAALGGALGKYGASKELKSDKVKKMVQDSYENNVKFSKEFENVNLAQGTDGLYGEEFSSKVNANRQEMQSLHNKISTVESAREGALARAASAQTSDEANMWQRKAAEHMVENARLQNDFNDKFGGEAYNSLMKLKRAYGDTTITIGGKEVKAFDNALSRHGVVVDPETAKVFNATKDVAARMGGNFSTKDPFRLLTEIEGAGGPRQRALMDGLAKGDEAMQGEFGKWASEFERLSKAAGIKRFTWTDKLPGSGGAASRKSSEQVFDFLEGRLDKSKLTPAQQSLATHIQVHYENTLNKLNAVRIANNLTPIKKRDNYVTHLTQMNNVTRHGVDLGTSEVVTAAPNRAGRIKMRFEEARTGEQASKDVYEALSSYTSSALRTIHLTQPRNQALALVELMDNAPSLKAGLTRFLNGPVFGGLGGIDSFLISNGAEGVVRFFDTFGKMIGRGTIPGNVKILIDQASQVLPTIAHTGPRYAAEGVAAMLGGGVPKEIRAMSRVLTQRGMAEEAGQQLGRAQRNLLGRSLNTAEGFSRHMMEQVDVKMAEFSWTSAFKQAKAAYSLSDKAAALYADDIARSLHGIYRDMYRPLLLQNKVVKGIWPFQTFTFNMWNALTTDAKARAGLKGTSRIAELARMAAAMEATNIVYNDVLGAPAPFNLGAADLTQYSKNDDGELQFNGRSKLPSVGPIGMATVPMFAQKSVEGGKAIKAAYNLAFNDEEDLDKRMADFMDASAKFGKNFISHGQQIYNTVKGINALKNGYVEIGREEVPLEAKDTVPALVLGPKNTPSARKAFQQR